MRPSSRESRNSDSAEMKVFCIRRHCYTGRLERGRCRTRRASAPVRLDSRLRTRGPKVNLTIFARILALAYLANLGLILAAQAADVEGPSTTPPPPAPAAPAP